MSRWLAVVSIYLKSFIFAYDCQLKLGMLYLPNQKSFFIWPSFPLWPQLKEQLRVLGKENSLFPSKPVIKYLICLSSWTNFELKQTMDRYGKECIALKNQGFLFLSPLSLLRT